jgi:hypothetical protein
MAGTALAVYLATLPPALTFRHFGTDGGDLIAAARTLGIPHPPGYPTYTLLAWLLSHLPVGTVAYRTNLLSALCASGAVGLVAMTALQLLAPHRLRWVPATAAALSMGFSPLTWSQAIISEVYAPLLLFASLLLYLLVRWRNGGHENLLCIAALVLGLGLGIHLTLVLAIPAAIVVLWPLRRRWLRPRTLYPSAGMLLTGLAVFSYLPLAARQNPPVNWADPDTWERFVWLVTGSLYRPLVFGLPTAAIAGRLSTWSRLLGQQFGWWGLAITLLGLAASVRRDRCLASAGLLWIACAGLFAFFYNSTDSIVYLLPSLPILALFWAEGARCLLDLAGDLRPWAVVVAATLLLFVPASSLARHWSEIDLSDDVSAQVYIDQLLDSLDPGAVVLVQNDQPTFALWYAQHADGLRPDIAVVNTSLLGFDWYRSQLRATYPHVEVPEPVGQMASIHELVRELVVRNYLSHPVFAVDPHEAWQTWFDIAPTKAGVVFRVQVKARWEQE